MGILIVKTIVTKIPQCVTIDHVTQIQNSLARMDAVFPNYGCVTSITIVEMILMNQLTCAGRKIALTDGDGVQDNRTTDVYQNGCSVMVRMIVEMDPMNCQKIVHLVIVKQISLVKTNVAFLSNGYAILLMIVEMEAMKRSLYANISTESALNQNLNVVMENVYPQDGVVTTKMTAEIILMRWNVVDSNAKMEHSSVIRVTVLQRTLDVMVIGTVGTYLMKLDVLHDSLVEDTVQKAGN